MKRKYNIENLRKVMKEKNCLYALLLGGRDIGKSYQVKYEVLKEAYITGCEIIYLRRYDTNLKTDLCTAYWDDFNYRGIVKEITEGTWDSVFCYQGKLYFARKDDEGKICEKQFLGYTHALNIASKYKSAMFPRVKHVIFEEVIPDGEAYLNREPTKLQEYISTIARDEAINVWMIGNTTSKLCPYFTDWHLDRVHKMKAHEIDVYTQDTSYKTAEGTETLSVSIAVECCAAEGLFSKMAFGEGSNQIIKNEFRRFTQPCADADFINMDCETLYTMFMLYQNLAFKMQFVRASDKEYFWYVKPAKNGIDIKDLEDQRVITDIIDYNPLHTGLAPVSQKEKRVFGYFSQNKIFYSDDQTGTDFKQCFRDMLKR